MCNDVVQFGLPVGRGVVQPVPFVPRLWLARGSPDINLDRGFDLPFSLVRGWVEEMVAVTVEWSASRDVSGGSSVEGERHDPRVGVAPEPRVEPEKVQKGRATPEGMECE